MSISNNGGSSVLVTGSISALNAMLSSSNGFSYRAPAGSAGTDLIVFTAVQVSTPIDLQNSFELIRFTDNTPIAESARRFMRMRWSLTIAP